MNHLNNKFISVFHINTYESSKVAWPMIGFQYSTVPEWSYLVMPWGKIYSFPVYHLPIQTCHKSLFFCSLLVSTSFSLGISYINDFSNDLRSYVVHILTRIKFYLLLIARFKVVYSHYVEVIATVLSLYPMLLKKFLIIWFLLLCM